MSGGSASFRHEFAAYARGTYLEVARGAPMADRVAAALQEYVTVCREEGRA